MSAGINGTWVPLRGEITGWKSLAENLLDLGVKWL